MKPAPALAGGGTALPAWPDAWYVVGPSCELARGQVMEGEIAHRQFVLFRDEAGGIAALDAHCPHMGTHLRSARVVGERLRCALHHWMIGSDGMLEGPPGCDEYRSRVWPALERFGLMFLWAGDAAPPAPPSFGSPEGYIWKTATPVALKSDWRAVAVSGFDTQHLPAVHQRALVKPPHLSRLAAGGVRMAYQTRVIPGGGWSSWLTQRLAGGNLQIVQICHGPTILVESRVGRFVSRAVFGFLPSGSATHAYAAFGTPAAGPLPRLRLWLTALLFSAFLRKDFAVVEDMQLIVDGPTDPGVLGISEYLRSLPELEGARRAR